MARANKALCNYDNVLQVMARVDEALRNFDQLELVLLLLRQTGSYHKRFVGFKGQYFRVNIVKIELIYTLLQFA